MVRYVQAVGEDAARCQSEFGMIKVQKAGTPKNKFNRMERKVLAVNGVVRDTMFHPAANDNQFFFLGRFEVKVKTSSLRNLR